MFDDQSATLKFSNPGTSLLTLRESTRAREESTDKLIEEVDPLVKEFVHRLFQLPSYRAFRPLPSEIEVQEQVKATIIHEIQMLPEKSDEILSEFREGKYDSFVFGRKPEITPELRVVIAQHNRTFMERLFTKCRSVEQFDFWIAEGGAKLPSDYWAMVVQFGNNIHVLQYLKNQGNFSALSENDKKQLLLKAARFENEGLAFLRGEFDAAATNRTKSKFSP